MQRKLPGNFETLFRNKDVRSLSRALSLVEELDPNILSFLSTFQVTNKAKIVGFSGLPGAGKSSLINEYIRYLIENGKTVGILAVDPTSPFSGGSILGDRIRFQDFYNEANVFIRSIGSRGKLGGLSQATPIAIELCEAYGFDYIIVESVGVGQNEVDIHQWVDCLAIVLFPGGGDDIQAIKSGILETGEFLVANKSDLPGTKALVTQLNQVVEMRKKSFQEVVTTSTQDLNSLKDLWKKIEGYLVSHSPDILRLRKEKTKKIAHLLMAQAFEKKLKNWLVNQEVLTNPYAAYFQFLQQTKDLFNN